MSVGKLQVCGCVVCMSLAYMYFYIHINPSRSWQKLFEIVLQKEFPTFNHLQTNVRFCTPTCAGRHASNPTNKPDADF